MRCLNPYFNGIYFLIVSNDIKNIEKNMSLNPYFNGIYFLMLFSYLILFFM